MDPDEALKKLREAIKKLRKMGQGALEPFSAFEAGEEVAEHAEALDQWLSKGGFLPKAWERISDKEKRWK